MNKIKGNHNVIGDNNKVIYGRPSCRPNPDHPNATLCPQCHEPTWAASDYCFCGYNLHEHRQHQATLRKLRYQTTWAAVMYLSAFIVALYASVYWASPFLGFASLGLMALSVIMFIKRRSFRHD